MQAHDGKWIMFAGYRFFTSPMLAGGKDHGKDYMEELFVCVWIGYDGNSGNEDARWLVQMDVRIVALRLCT